MGEWLAAVSQASGVGARRIGVKRYRDGVRRRQGRLLISRCKYVGGALPRYCFQQVSWVPSPTCMREKQKGHGAFTVHLRARDWRRLVTGKDGNAAVRPCEFGLSSPVTSSSVEETDGFLYRLTADSVHEVSLTLPVTPTYMDILNQESFPSRGMFT